MKYKYLMVVFVLLNTISQAQVNLDSLLNVWQDETQTDSTRTEAFSAYINEGFMYSDADTVFILAQSLLNYAEEHQYETAKAKAYRLMGNSAYYTGDIPLSLDYYQRSLKLFEKSGDKSGTALVLNGFGTIYKSQGDYPKALDYFHRSLKIFEEIGDKSASAKLTSNIGTIYLGQGDYTRSLDNFKRSLMVFEEIGDAYNSAIVNSFIGAIYGDQKDYSKALDFFQSSLIILEETGNKYFSAQVRLNMGNIYYHQKAYSKTLEYSKKALLIAQEINSLEQERLACEYLYETYKTMGKSNEALVYLEKLNVITDSLHAEGTTKKLQQMEFEKVMLQDSIAKAEEARLVQEAHETEMQSQAKTRNIIIAVAIFFVLLAGGFYSRVLYIRKTNKELSEKNKIIAREKERAEESEKAKELFFDNISHEFRTPLTLILGPLEEVLDNKIDESSRTNLQIMQRSALRLQGMINELLELSKLEFKQLGLRAKEEDIVSITKEYLQSFESLADQHKIKLSFKSQKISTKAFIDLEKYQKILANLLSNAMKFTGEGGRINVSVSSQYSATNIKSTAEKQLKTDDFKEGVLITISDTGIGIPADKLPHIFDRFFQVGEKSQTHQAGTGIGLALTKGLVELHHGTIAVESVPGKGTTFNVFIPFGSEHLGETEIVTEETIQPETKETKEQWAVEQDISGHVLEDEIRKKNDKPLLLIVEDNPDMLAYTSSHLDKTYKIITAKDGEEGLVKALEQIPDLIISDVMMPKMDGNVMTEKLKTDQRTSHIPVIILTARASVESKIEGLETGADAYVTKPFNARELKIRVKNLIEQRQRLRDHFAKELDSGMSVSTISNLPSMDQRFVEKAIEIVNNNLSNTDFDVKLFAQEMAVSRTQLHRKITAITSKNTSEFIRTIRLNKAAELLKAKTDNVTQIAYETGFTSLSWFTKSFKEQYGVTPSEYMNT
jgi:signal transduction histidine kinase/DNA-binding response OmpR family regulator/Tfp pilus assembly protein PilF